MSGWLLPVIQDRIRFLRAQGKRIPTRPPRPKRVWLYPWAVEGGYLRTVEKYMKQLASHVDLSNYPQWLASTQLTQDDEAFGPGWGNMLTRLRKAQHEMFEGREAEHMHAAIFGFGEDVSKFNKAQWKSFLSGMTGTEYYPPEAPDVAEALKLWADQNFELIRSLSDSYIGKVNNLVTTGVQKGTRYTDIMTALRAMDETMTHNRAKLIARDQVGKLNGQLSKSRQWDAGISDYTWSTSGDERVRGNPKGPFKRAIPSHFVMDGIVCNWRDSSVYLSGGHWVPRTGIMPQAIPGEGICCRCTAIPYMDGIWAKAIKEAA